jgi:hypothetical protein
MTEVISQPIQGSKKHRVKLIHLIYTIVALVALSIVAVIVVWLLSAKSTAVTMPVGNGWYQETSYQPFTVGSKLYMTFIGIESCEYCAAERYAIFYALSNFGNWTYYDKRLNISILPVNNYTTNPQPDALFYKAAEGDWTLNFLAQALVYKSNYIDFSSIEALDNTGAQLQSLNSIQSGYMAKYDPSGAVPFSVIGGNFYEVGAGNSLVQNSIPIIFMQNGTGYSPSEIIGAFNVSGSTINEGITKEADYISALICADINNSAPVCSSPIINAIASKLNV